MITNPLIINALSAEDQAAAAAIDTKHIEDHRRFRAEAAVQRKETVRRFGPSEVRLLVVPASFQDVSYSLQLDRLETLLGRVADYYAEVSGGNVKLLPPKITRQITLPGKSAYYSHVEEGRGPDEPNAKTMARDALIAFGSEITDFLPFDTDHDGRIDAFVVVHAGRPAESLPPGERAGLIWSHRGFGGNARTMSGYLVDEFLTVSEESPLGVWCHELGHLLFSWPDVAQRQESDGQQDTHTWCLMSSGGWNGPTYRTPDGSSPAHPCAPLKMRQGWVARNPIQVNGGCEITSIEDSKRAIVIQPPADASRWLVIENRAQVEFDRGLAGDGLLIWDVVGLDTMSEPGITLVPATGTFDTVARGTAADPFPGTEKKTTLEKYGITINSISEAGPTMHFNVLGLPARGRPVRHN